MSNLLVDIHPGIASEWHPTLNQGEKLDAITIGSKKNVWWMGKECQHVWDSNTYNRLKTGKCPYCIGKRVLVGFNDLETQFPEVAKQWHPTKNNNLLPRDITGKSGKRVWWQCSLGHEWDCAVGNRTQLRSNCPYCANKKVLAGYNDLVTTHAQLSLEWHPTKNSPITPQSIIAGSNKKVWWLGECRHEWEAQLTQRVSSNSGCPYCSSHQTLAGFNDFVTKYPELAKEWHPTKNMGINPTELSSSSKLTLWWRNEECNHEWRSTIANRTTKSAGCLVCSSRTIIAGVNDLASQFPLVSSEWHPTKNFLIKSNTIPPMSGKKAWWLCADGHEWEAKISRRTSLNAGCSICANQKVLFGFNDLESKHPDIAKTWHPTKNGELTPKDIISGTKKKFWWIGDCRHEWETGVAARLRSNQNLCPKCSLSELRVGVTDLGTTHPEVASEWHPTENTFNVCDQTAKSAKKAWWLGKCGHEWFSTIRNRAILGYGCVVCSGKQILLGFNDLASQRPKLATQWHPTKNGVLTTEGVTVGSGTRVWWICEKGHEWETPVNSRATRYETNCPDCNIHNYVSKAEHKLTAMLSEHGFAVQQSNRKILDGTELDIYIPKKKLAIEYNGLYWHTEAWGKDRAYHHSKWLKCKEKGIQLIQIWEDDWNRSPEQVKSMLLNKLGANKQRSVFAQETVALLIDHNEAKSFLDKHDMREWAEVGLHYLGLRENGTGEIVAVMVLKRESAGKILNITRYATSANVIDGFGDLVAYAAQELNPEKFIIFSDNCISDGSLYSDSGFLADKELAPDYQYVVGAIRKPKTDYSLTRFQNDPKLIWEEGKTERELADLNGLKRIWDAGKTRWVKNII